MPPRQKPGQQPGKTYRGRRRLPKLPSRRYAAVVTTAFMGASVVALAAGAVVPDNLASQYGDDPAGQELSVADRLNALDQASRSEERYGPAFSVDPDAPDVWLLPLQAKFDITTLFEMRWGTMHFGVDMAAPVRHADLRGACRVGHGLPGRGRLRPLHTDRPRQRHRDRVRSRVRPARHHWTARRGGSEDRPCRQHRLLHRCASAFRSEHQRRSPRPDEIHAAARRGHRKSAGRSQRRRSDHVAVFPALALLPALAALGRHRGF